jgi:Biopterin-dependent aromatic amino acid hydroxylase
VDDPSEATIIIPNSIHEINNCSILGYGGDLAEGHPGYHDEEYKRRRTAISDIARDHRVCGLLVAFKTLYRALVD